MLKKEVLLWEILGKSLRMSAIEAVCKPAPRWTQQQLRKNTEKPAVIPIGTEMCQSPPKLQEASARFWGKECLCMPTRKGTSCFYVLKLHLW